MKVTSEEIATEERGGLAKKIPFLSLSDKTKNRLKLAVSAALFISLFVFGKVDLSKSLEAALAADKGLLSVAALLFLGSVFVLARRWQVLAATVNLEAPFLKMVQYCYVGLFFNMFLPSTIGGDFTKCYYLSKGKAEKGSSKYLHALSSVLVDRALGVAVLLFFASIGILLGPEASSLPMEMKAPIILGTVSLFLFLPFLPQLSNKILGESNWLSRKLNQSTAKAYWQNKPAIMNALLLSVVFQFLMVASHLMVGLSLGFSLEQVPLWYYFVFYPLVAVLGFVTPSVNGIGVREWAYTYFLTMSGVDSATALTYAIIWLGMTTLGSVVGGIVYVLGHLRIPKEETEALQG